MKINPAINQLSVLRTLTAKISTRTCKNMYFVIVPMPPKWIEMTEQLKKEEKKTKRKRSRKSEGRFFIIVKILKIKGAQYSGC